MGTQVDGTVEWLVDDPTGLVVGQRRRSGADIIFGIPQVIAVSNIPFLIMPGDGAANGCQFTGTNGAFTLSAAIQANVGASLAGCYAYLPASFGGSSLPAGWYWTEFSSDTAGRVYAETYVVGSGTPRRPATKTEITPNLSGWVTGSTSEITGPSGFTLPGTALGKNGTLSWTQRVIASTSASGRNYRLRANNASTTIFGIVGGASSSPVFDGLLNTVCMDSHTAKSHARNATGNTAGIGVAATSVVAAHYTDTCDTSVDQSLYVTLQQGSNIATAILMNFAIVATYGE